MKKIIPLLSILIVFIFGFVALITKTPVGINIAWTVLAIFGAYMSISSVTYSLMSHKGKSWPQSLYVLNDEIIRDRVIEKKKRYYVSANIEYEVNGKKYNKNLRDDYNESYFNNHDEAMSYLNKIKSNRSKRIYYNPVDPTDSILTPGINIRSILAILVGIGLVYIAVASFIGFIIWA